MELRHLRYFAAVAEALSFTKAAEKQHVAQPSLSRQIRDLEEEIGVRLFHRNKQSVSLTDAGRSFLVDVKRLLEQAAEAVSSAQRVSRHGPSVLKIGYVSNLFQEMIPATLQSFRAASPTVDAHIFDLSCGEQLRALANGDIDVGFVGLHEPLAARQLESIAIAEYNTVVALPQRAPLARKRSIKLKDLQDMFFIAISEASYPGYEKWLMKTCWLSRFVPKIVQVVSVERTMIEAVGAGLGIALVPEHLTKLPHRNVVFRPLVPSVVTRGCIAWKSSNRSEALLKYIRIVEEAGMSPGPNYVPELQIVRG